MSNKFLLVGIFIIPAVLGMTGCATAPADELTSTSVRQIVQRYPAGSIQSVERADEVLSTVKAEENMLEYQFGLDMDACTRKFLVNNCYDETRLRLRQDKAALKPLRIEADRFKRAEKVRLRDEALMATQQKELSRTAEREASRRKFEEKSGRYLSPEEAAAASAERPSETVPRSYSNDTDHYSESQVGAEAAPAAVDEEGAYTRLQQSQPKNTDGIGTKKRGENVEAYRQKQRDAARRQEAVNQRIAETEARRQRRKAKPADSPAQKVPSDE